MSGLLTPEAPLFGLVLALDARLLGSEASAAPVAAAAAAATPAAATAAAGVPSSEHSKAASGSAPNLAAHFRRRDGVCQALKSRRLLPVHRRFQLRHEVIGQPPNDVLHHE
eukprot:112156-Chlamydomonas_euryale.AAC.1